MSNMVKHHPLPLTTVDLTNGATLRDVFSATSIQVLGILWSALSQTIPESNSQLVKVIKQVLI